MQGSGLQNKVFGREQKPLLNKINASVPDIIVITGDLLDRHEGRTDVESAMELQILRPFILSAATTNIRAENGKRC